MSIVGFPHYGILDLFRKIATFQCVDQKNTTIEAVLR